MNDKDRAVAILVKGTDAYKNQLKADAAKEGKSLAEYVRELLDAARNLKAETKQHA